MECGVTKRLPPSCDPLLYPPALAANASVATNQQITSQHGQPVLWIVSIVSLRRDHLLISLVVVIAHLPQTPIR